MKDIYEAEEFEFAGVDMSDYPDFCDAYVIAASWPDGTELSEHYIDKINDDHQFVYERLIASMH